MPIERRDFIKSTTAALTVGAATLALKPHSVLGANDRVRVAICGTRGRGVDHIHGFNKVPNVEIVALCDVDENVLNQRLADVEKLGRPKPKAYTDVRKLLEDKEIDAVSIATPNHWHSLIGIWTLQAGKDVYVEKPCSHNTFEGRQLVAAVKKYNRICQHGSQWRSNPGLIEAMKHLKEDGTIGDVYMARGLCFKWRPSIGKAPQEPVPAGVHYDLWTGPAPLKPFTKNRFHYNWHWIWDTGNGDIGNQAIHEIDIARAGLGVGFPVQVSAIGGHFMFDDDQQTPNTLNAAYIFETADGKRKMMEIEVRHWITNHEAEIGTGAYGASSVPPAGLTARQRPQPRKNPPPQPSRPHRSARRTRRPTPSGIFFTAPTAISPSTATMPIERGSPTTSSPARTAKPAAITTQISSIACARATPARSTRRSKRRTSPRRSYTSPTCRTASAAR